MKITDFTKIKPLEVTKDILSRSIKAVSTPQFQEAIKKPGEEILLPKPEPVKVQKPLSETFFKAAQVGVREIETGAWIGTSKVIKPIADSAREVGDEYGPLRPGSQAIDKVGDFANWWVNTSKYLAGGAVKGIKEGVKGVVATGAAIEGASRYVQGSYLQGLSNVSAPISKAVEPTLNTSKDEIVKGMRSFLDWIQQPAPDVFEEKNKAFKDVQPLSTEQMLRQALDPSFQAYNLMQSQSKDRVADNFGKALDVAKDVVNRVGQAGEDFVKGVAKQSLLTIGYIVDVLERPARHMALPHFYNFINNWTDVWSGTPLTRERLALNRDIAEYMAGGKMDYNWSLLGGMLGLPEEAKAAASDIFVTETSVREDLLQKRPELQKLEELNFLGVNLMSALDVITSYSSAVGEAKLVPYIAALGVQYKSGLLKGVATGLAAGSAMVYPTATVSFLGRRGFLSQGVAEWMEAEAKNDPDFAQTINVMDGIFVLGGVLKIGGKGLKGWTKSFSLLDSVKELEGLFKRLDMDPSLIGKVWEDFKFKYNKQAEFFYRPSTGSEGVMKVSDIQKWGEVIDKLPPEAKGQLDRIKLAAFFHGADESSLAGKWEEGAKRLGLNIDTLRTKIGKGVEATQTMLHELGHSFEKGVWADPELGPEWAKVTEGIKFEEPKFRLAPEEFSRDYAKTSPGEYFAEGFRKYYDNPVALKAENEKLYEFMGKVADRLNKTMGEAFDSVKGAGTEGMGRIKDDLTSSIQKAKASGQSFDEWVKGQQPEKVTFVSASKKQGYMGGHEAPLAEDINAPIWDLTGKYTGGDLYPKDIYSADAARLYSAGEPYDGEAIAKLQLLEGRPNKQITVYRAVSKGNPSEINPGDWVSLTRAYAKDHGESNLNGDYKIIKKTVYARDVFTNADSIHEFGYDPQPRVNAKDMPYSMLERSLKAQPDLDKNINGGYIKQLKAEWDKVGAENMPRMEVKSDVIKKAESDLAELKKRRALAPDEFIYKEGEEFPEVYGKSFYDKEIADLTTYIKEKKAGLYKGLTGAEFMPRLRQMTTKGFDPTVAKSVNEAREILGLAEGEIVTFKDMKEIGAAYGATPEEILKMTKTLTEQDRGVISALKQGISTNVDEIKVLFKERQALVKFLTEGGKNPEGNFKTLKEYDWAINAKKATQLKLVDKLTRGASETARSLVAMKMTADRIDDGAYWLYQAQKTKGTMLTPDEAAMITDLLGKGERLMMVEAIGHLREASWMEKGITLWKAGLLTSPMTHLRNIGSNTVTGTMEIVKDIPAAFYDSIASIFTGKRTTAFGDLTQVPKGWSKGWAEAMDVMKYGQVDNPKAEILREVNFKNRTINKYQQLIFRSLGAEDKVFKGVAYQVELSKEAKVIAMNERLKGKEFTARVKELMGTPTPDMHTKAEAQALQATFNKDNALADIVKRAKKGKGPNLLLETSMPFVRTPTNVAEMLAEYSPAGFVKALYYGLKGDQRAVVDALGRMTTGSGFIALGSYLASQGMMTGTYPTGGDEKKRWRLENLRAGDLIINGRQYNLMQLSPFGNLMQMGASWYEAGQEHKDIFDRITATGGEGLKGLTQQTFLFGLSKVLEAVTKPQTGMRDYVDGLIGGMVPTVLRQLVEAGDQYKRVRTAHPLGALMYSVPGLRQQLPPTRDVFGRKVETDVQATSGDNYFVKTLERLFDPTISRPVQTGELEAELRRLQETGTEAVYPARPGKNRTYSRSIKLNGHTYKLSVPIKMDSYIYDKFIEIQGEIYMDAMEEIIKTKEYQSMPPDKQAQVWDDVRNNSVKIAMDLMLPVFNEEDKEFNKELKAQLAKIGKEDKDFISTVPRNQIINTKNILERRL